MPTKKTDGMLMTAVLTPSPEGGLVAFNSQTGVTSQGDTIESALANLQEAVELFLDIEPTSSEGRTHVLSFEVGRTERLSNTFEDDSHLPLSIIHDRTFFDHEGELEEEFNSLLYTFAASPEPVTVLVDIRDPWKATVMTPEVGSGQQLPMPVIDYLTRRFDFVEQHRIGNAKQTIWGD